MGVVILASAWKQVSYDFIFFLAGLQSIPRSVVEAARIDGARAWRRFRTIILPLLIADDLLPARRQPRLRGFDTFGTIQALTQGGPGKATETLSCKVYRDGVVNLDLGGSSAQSVVLMVAVVALTVVQFRYVGRQVQTDGGDREPALLTFARHLILMLGVAMFALPVWLMFVGVDAGADAMLRAPMPLLPGPHLIENYAQVLRDGLADGAHGAGLAHAADRLGHGAGRSRSARSSSRCSRPTPSSSSASRSATLRSGPIFVTLMLPVEVRIMPDLLGDGGARHDQHLHRADHAADRLGHRHASCSGSSSSPSPTSWSRRRASTAPGRCASSGTSCCRCLGRQHRRAVRHPVRLRLEPVPLAAADHHRRSDSTPIVIGIVRDDRGGDAATEWNLVMATAMLAMLPPVAGRAADAALVRARAWSRRTSRDGHARDCAACARAYGNREVLHGIDLELADGEMLVIVGASGCGKSHAAAHGGRAGDAITGGAVVIGDRVVNELEPKDRDIAMVFQNYALYPHMTRVRQHGLRPADPRPVAEDEIGPRVERGGRDRSSSARCSSASRASSRAASASASRWAAPSCASPSVFLFDEPLSNLDAKLRVQMRARDPAACSAGSASTSLYVTHDQVEAMTLGDRLIVHERRPRRPDRHADGGVRAPGRRSSSPASSARRR